jgi:hypothetical protein
MKSIIAAYKQVIANQTAKIVHVVSRRVVKNCPTKAGGVLPPYLIYM